MAEGSSPAAKKVKVDGEETRQERVVVSEMNGSGRSSKIAFVTGITGQVRRTATQLAAPNESSSRG